MNPLFVFALRAVLGIVFAVILIRFFFPQGGVIWIITAAAVLVGLAYITESIRKREKKNQDKGSH